MVYSDVSVTPLRSPVKPSETVRHAFRMVVEKNQFTLKAIEEVHGEFRKLRQRAWAPGMLCCRLLNQNNEVLAEETMISPDYRCVVLDPNQLDAQGRPQAARLTAEGPVVFQARFPKVDDAAILKIYRLTGSTPPQGNDEPEGQLLSAITFAK